MTQQVLKTKYVLDTGFFVLMRQYYPEVFPSFWERLNELAVNEVVTSVIAVRQEIENYGGDQGDLLIWVEHNRHLFAEPASTVQNKVREIMKVAPKALSKRQQIKGGLWADAFVIAKAFDLSATVITREKYDEPEDGQKPRLIKIPNICKHFDIPCISPRKFMKDQQWHF